MATTPRRRVSDKNESAAHAVVAAAAPVAAAPQGFGADGATPLVSVTLEMIVAATLAGSFLYAAASVADPLAVSGDVEINPSMSANGMHAVRATPQGIAKMTTTAPATETTAQDAPAPAAAPAAAAAFEVFEAFELPKAQRQPGHGNTKYPFDTLPVGGAFFVPGGSVKKLASTVASANARYSEVIKDEAGNVLTRVNRKKKTVPQTRQLRVFKVRNGKHPKTEEIGAFIGRVPVTAETQAEAQAGSE